MGLAPGIKVDTGAKPLTGAPGKTVTEGLDGLRERLQDFASRGAVFAKWRAVITIGPGLPTHRALHANAHALARYAMLCQEQGIVPIVEPEVVASGSHVVEQCEAVTNFALHDWRGEDVEAGQRALSDRVGATSAVLGGAVSV